MHPPISIIVNLMYFMNMTLWTRPKDRIGYFMSTMAHTFPSIKTLPRTRIHTRIRGLLWGCSSWFWCFNTDFTSLIIGVIVILFFDTTPFRTLWTFDMCILKVKSKIICLNVAYKTSFWYKRHFLYSTSRQTLK